jgi:hypothetical protein
MRNTMLTIILAALLAAATPAAADEPPEFIPAYRIARADAINQLCAKIAALSLTADATVADWLAQSDELDAAVRAFLASLGEMDSPTYTERGDCELTVGVPLDALGETLAAISKRYVQSDRFDDGDLKRLNRRNTQKVLTAKGAGSLGAGDAQMLPITDGDVLDESLLTEPARTTWSAHVSEPGRRAAVRDARADGLRRLALRLADRPVGADTTLRDLVGADYVRVASTVFCRGARPTGVRYTPSAAIVEVEMHITLVDALTSARSWLRAHVPAADTLRMLDEAVVNCSGESLWATGMAATKEEHVDGIPAHLLAVMATAGDIPDGLAIVAAATGRADVKRSARPGSEAETLAAMLAELDARKQLLERVADLPVTDEQTLSQWTAADPAAGMAILAAQQAASITQPATRTDEGDAMEVVVELDLAELWRAVVQHRLNTAAAEPTPADEPAPTDEPGDATEDSAAEADEAADEADDSATEAADEADDSATEPVESEEEPAEAADDVDEAADDADDPAAEPEEVDDTPGETDDSTTDDDADSVEDMSDSVIEVPAEESD